MNKSLGIVSRLLLDRLLSAQKKKKRHQDQERQCFSSPCFMLTINTRYCAIGGTTPQCRCFFWFFLAFRSLPEGKHTLRRNNAAILERKYSVTYNNLCYEFITSLLLANNFKSCQHNKYVLSLHCQVPTLSGTLKNVPYVTQDHHIDDVR